MHLFERNELVRLGALTQQRQRRRQDGQPRLASPARLEVFGDAFVQPNGYGVAALLRNDQMDVLVRERVEPVVPMEDSLRARHHQFIELADGDGTGGLNLLTREGGNLRELARIVDDLNANFAWGCIPEVVEQGGSDG